MINVNQVIKLVKPEVVLVSYSNYLQCIKNGNLCEYQICYKSKKWYEFKSYGSAMNPQEIFINYIN